MAHLSLPLQHRFLARLLSPEETLDVIKHLQECDSCREALSALRSQRRGSVADSILPETPIEEHPSADSLGAYLDDDLGHSDKVDLEAHLRTCELCQKAFADLKFFREGLLQSPVQAYAPVAKTTQSSGATSFGHRWFRHEISGFLNWFNQPLVYAGTAAVAALIVVFGAVVVRSPETFGIGGNGQVAVSDGGHRITVGPNGITNPPASVPSDVLTALNNVATPIVKGEPPSLSLTLKDNLAALKRAPSTLLGQPSGPVPFQVLSPVRTLVESARPTFKWTAAPGATGYVVHVIADDRTQEEAATSPVVIPTTDANTCQWVLAESAALSPGKRYRWYVTATVKDQEVDAPGIEQAQAKFAVLSEEEIARLNDLRKSAQGDRLIGGLLNLNAGLLDEAQSDFEYLLADPGQTEKAKLFLQGIITEIGRLKET
jgi:predicted anti-sigma-YlaC factor YlaD